MSELSFRRSEPRPQPRGGSLVALLLVVVTVLAASRPWWSPSLPDGVLIEISGEVPRPGLVIADAPTVASALAAAGLEPDRLRPLPPDVLAEGDRLEVRGGRVRVLPPSRPLLVALPIDINTAGIEALEAIPGLGASTAAAIVEDREIRGPFPSLDGLVRVRGVGPSTVAKLAPFVEAPQAEPIDLNQAGVEQLQLLPGVGPVIAARIVVDRADRGPFASVEELIRVHGIGEATVERIREQVVVP
ncbi:MAG TPA: helix-hairpin-helix domain-containing protein [Deltaproteobacteria bacterium]|nr:helix-hairpin-helix domain-containing protein [Deltaproteobacteria bacterium]